MIGPQICNPSGNLPFQFFNINAKDFFSSLDVMAEVVKAFQSAIVQLHGNDEQSDDLKYHFAGAGRMLITFTV